MQTSKLTIFIFGVLSLLLLVWQQYGMNRTMAILPEMAELAYAQNDDVNGGASIGTVNLSNGKLSLNCKTVRVGQIFPFCGLRQPLTDTHEPIDISGYDTLKIRLDFTSNDRDTIMVYLMGEAGLNDLNEPISKSMLRTIDPSTGVNLYTLQLDEFLVPSWWMFAHPDKDSAAQLDKITDIQISTGDAVHEREETITIWRMELNGKWIDQTELIVFISLFWVLVALNTIRETNEMKAKFFANMSHEIRTPMNGVLLALNLARSSKDANEANKLLDTAISTSHLMLEIINDILDISKLESGKFTIRAEKWIPHRLIQDSMRLMSPLAKEKGLKLVVENELDSDAICLGDETRVGQVVNNLISNAIKFTEEGSVTLRAVHKNASDQTYLHVEVEDTGPGISTADQATLFDRFVQVDKEAHAHKGTGLGLAISKELVSLMGGQLRLDSDGKSGSRFYFSIPSPFADNQKMDEQEEALEGGVGSLNILLVEDIVLIQNLLTAMLKQLGHRVSVAENGKKAVEKATEDSADFDLILMDNQMPVMSGIDATSKLRKLGVTTPIIALTADAMDSAREAFDNAGVNGFVAKPVSEDLLVKEIASVISKRARDKA